MADAPIGGADWLILEAIQAGHCRVPDIAAYARIEPKFVRVALNRLRTTGRVRRYGKKRHARYVLINRKKHRPRKKRRVRKTR